MLRLIYGTYILFLQLKYRDKVQGFIMYARVCLFIFLIFMLLALPANAMRCSQKLVYEGDTYYDVENKCGEPLDKLVIEETVPLYNPAGYLIGATSKKREIWIYQRSPLEFRYEVIFENGRVKEITAKRAP